MQAHLPWGSYLLLRENLPVTIGLIETKIHSAEKRALDIARHLIVRAVTWRGSGLVNVLEQRDKNDKIMTLENELNQFYGTHYLSKTGSPQDYEMEDGERDHFHEFLVRFKRVRADRFVVRRKPVFEGYEYPWRDPNQTRQLDTTPQDAWVDNLSVVEQDIITEVTPFVEGREPPAWVGVHKFIPYPPHEQLIREKMALELLLQDLDSVHHTRNTRKKKIRPGG